MLHIIQHEQPAGVGYSILFKLQFLHLAPAILALQRVPCMLYGVLHAPEFCLLEASSVYVYDLFASLLCLGGRRSE